VNIKDQEFEITVPELPVQKPNEIEFKMNGI